VSPEFGLFVYGTLKRGLSNHERFCRGVLDIREAFVQGELYEMPSGIPVLHVPDEAVLARGTADPLHDAAVQARISARAASSPDPPAGDGRENDPPLVYGELMTFSDPLSRLPAIDRLEGFTPGSRSLYQRVLVKGTVLAPGQTDGRAVPMWLYAGTDPTLGRCTYTGRSSWP
jgi:gamma-glutamylcyclotransferase (GGCT)/AIG2-like uncharacterized protein YtfP